MSSAASLACASTDNINELKEYNGILGEDFETKPLSDSERVPELPAQQMIKLAGLLEGPSEPLMILDNAAGGSALVTALLFDMLPKHKVQNLQVIAADVSEAAVRSATRKVETWANASHVMTIQMNMEKMEGMCDRDFSHVLTNFGIALAKDTEATLAEILRVLKPGGICGFTTWSYLSWICLLRSAIATIPGAPSFPHEQDVLLYLSNQKPWHDQTFVHKTLDKAGFIDIKIEEFTAIHAFTKMQFIETFGGAVVRYLTRRIFGKETAETYATQIPDALEKYLDEHHPNGIQLEVRSLIVIAKKKSEDSRRGSGSSSRSASSPKAEIEEIKKLQQEAEVPHF